METKPMAWHEHGPVDALDEEVNEHRVQGERGATICHNALLKDKKAPKAEPEEDIDIMECENQESASISPENQEVAEPVDQCNDCFPPPPSLSAITTGDFCEKELFFSLHCEVTGVISDVHSDAKEDLNSPDSQDSQERPRSPQLLEPIDEEMTSEEMMGEENVSQLDVLPYDISTTEMNTSQPARHSPSDSNASDDVNTVSSPPFADESEEEEEEEKDFIFCAQQKNTLDVSSKSFLLSDSSSDCADHSAKQQEALLPQSQRELSPRGVNQEAPQQVLSQRSPPLSSVAMELSNQGGAGSQASGCVLAVRERHSRAGEDTEVKKEQTGGEKGQKESRFRRIEPAGQQHSGGGYSTVQVQEIKTDKHHCGVSLKHTSHTRMENDVCDDSQSDSGLSADFSPLSTLETTTTISTGSPTTASKETPIEREIRRAIEREHSLRRSRGLPNPPSSPEYVDFPLKKNVLRQSIPTKSERYQDKDREFAGKKMQHEIYEEIRREQDLVKLGKIPGFYDKGIDRQIKEKKQIFEAFQTPSDSTFTIPTRSKAASSSSSSSGDGSTLGKQEDSSSQSSTVGSLSEERRSSLDVPDTGSTPYLNSAKGGGITNPHPRGPGYSEGSGRQVIIFENNLSIQPQKNYHVQSEPGAVTVVDSGYQNISSSKTGGHHHTWLTEREQEKEDEEEEEEEEVAPTENPFFKLRSSANLVKVKQDIQEARKREKDLRKQRISIYGRSGGAHGGGGGLSPISSSFNGLTDQDIPGSAFRVDTGPSAVRQSVSNSSMWTPTQTDEERIYWAEAVQSPRTPRQKTPLVERWESGLINGHNEEDD